jgi:Tol biopolymer transport system component
MEPYPVLSLDGRRLAFVAQNESRRSLWVQRVGTLDPVPLPGTEGASAPFWSPDGRFVGFLADGRLKKVSLAGDRPVQTLSKIPAAYGGTWMAGGMILFSGADGLYRVPAEGGEAVQVTRLNHSRGEFSHRWPSALPGSPSRFAYLIRSTGEDARGIHLASLENPSVKRRLVPDDSNGVFSVAVDGSIRLSFVHDATLVSQAFDPRSERVTGDAVVVSSPVAPGETGRLAPFSVAASTVVYRRSDPLPNRLIWMNRRGERLTALSEEATEHRYLTLSPDGMNVATAQVEARTGRLDIWIVDLRRQTRERLTRDPVGALFPVWMPDGHTIVYASAQAGVFDLYSRPASASTDATVLFRAATPVLKYPTDVTRDGRYVVFQGASQLFRLSLTGDRSLSPLPQGIQGRVSPDGRWLAYTSTENPVRQVYVTTFPEPTERWRISITAGEDPQWRSDGRELFYIEGGQTLMVVPVQPGREFSIGAPRPLFRASFPPRGMPFGPSYSPTPDGQRFLVLEAERDGEILLRVITNWAPR